MPYLTIGTDEPARDLPPRDPAPLAPHPLAPTAETDSEHLWAVGAMGVGAWDALKWALDPERGFHVLTLKARPAVTR